MSRSNQCHKSVWIYYYYYYQYQFRFNSFKAKTFFCKNSTNLSYMNDDQYLSILKFSVKISIFINDVCNLCCWFDFWINVIIINLSASWVLIIDINLVNILLSSSAISMCWSLDEQYISFRLYSFNLFIQSTILIWSMFSVTKRVDIE